MLSRESGILCVDAVPLPDVADQFGTPTYVYSRSAIVSAWGSLSQALSTLPHQICYAVKANSNLGVLSVLASLGSGFDIVSVGELARVLRAGAEPGRVVFAGVGKRRDELAAALEAKIGCFNVESIPELERLEDVARAHGVRAPVALRVNPDVDALTHPYIATGLRDNKFGIPIAEAVPAYVRVAESDVLRVSGIACHIGSQLLTTEPFRDALGRVTKLADELVARGIFLEHIDIGGGLGVAYSDEQPPTVTEYANAVTSMMRGRSEKLVVEPGRSLVANAGVLLTRTEYLKFTEHKNFLVCDAAMNDLIRPALYDAWMGIEVVEQHDDVPAKRYDVVGPVCESGDFLGRDRSLAVREGDLLVVKSAGAYGFSMSSNYNSRPRAAEVLVDAGRCQLVRGRETLDDLMRGEWVLAD